MTNRIDTSPSGRYTLTISSIETKPGCWNYSVGLIQKANGEKIEEVKRNYHSFPFLWVEDHPNGHDYLVCGEDYQGQTVIELDTGNRRDFVPSTAKMGAGFCWVEYTFDASAQILVVEGCVWACPFEFRFYDFSDPMNGWDELKMPENVDGYAEGESPSISETGEITLYETRDKGELDGAQYASDDYSEDKVPVATTTLRREGNSLVVVDTWVDEAEKVRRDEDEAARLAYEKAWEEYKKTDPLFLRVMERVESEDFDNKPYSLSVGQTYDGWHPTDKFSDSRVCKRIAEWRQVGPNHVTMELQWGRKEAPIKLQVYLNNGKPLTSWYSRSLGGMDEALDAAKEFLKA